MMEASPAEQMIACMSREIRNGDILGVAIATPLVMAAYALARLTHAPDVLFAYTVGGTVSDVPSRLSLTWQESPPIQDALRSVDLDQIVTEWMLRLPQYKNFLRPVQMDPHGNVNNLVIGDHRSPRVRLPGAAGIPDVSASGRPLYYYVPRHSPQTFVPRVDFLCGLGTARVLPGGAVQPYEQVAGNPVRVVTDLAVLDFDDDGRMRLLSTHRGVAVDRVERMTGFPLGRASSLTETPPPTDAELTLLREHVDPQGVRDLDFLDKVARRRRILDIAEAEGKER